MMFRRLMAWFQRHWPCFVLPWHRWTNVTKITAPHTAACGWCGREWDLRTRTRV